MLERHNRGILWRDFRGSVLRILDPILARGFLSPSNQNPSYMYRQKPCGGVASRIELIMLERDNRGIFWMEIEGLSSVCWIRS